MADKLDMLIDAAAEVLQLPVEEAWKPAVKTNLQAIRTHMDRVLAAKLPDDAEPGPVFRA